MSDVHYKETKLGFEYGAARVERVISDARAGVVVSVSTTSGEVVHVRVTPKGRIRVGKVGRRVFRRLTKTWEDVGAPLP